MVHEPLHVVLPPLADVPSGGNVYNARIFEGLGDELPVELHFVAPGGAAPRLPARARVLVDSLLMAEASPLLEQAGRRGLLVHHLHLFDPETRDGERARLERGLLPGYDFFVVTSAWSARALSELGVPGSRIGVVHPGLDAHYLQPCRTRSGGDSVRLLTVASLIARKGLLELLGVLGRIAAPPAFTWTIAGTDRIEPTYARRFAAALAETGLGPRVRVQEVAPDAMAALYDDSDLLLSAARFETLGMAIREAMARGLPVLAWDVGGIGESIVDGETGYLVRAGQDDAFAERLRALIVDDALRARLGGQARRRALTFPSWNEARLHFADACAAPAATAGRPA
jgi:glycosyltransferase involved in cell wall biosynthesis